MMLLICKHFDSLDTETVILVFVSFQSTASRVRNRYQEMETVLTVDTKPG